MTHIYWTIRLAEALHHYGYTNLVQWIEEYEKQNFLKQHLHERWRRKESPEEVAEELHKWILNYIRHSL